MKNHHVFFKLFIALLFAGSFAQGQTINTEDHSVQCGSHQLIEFRDKLNPGYQQLADQSIESLRHIIETKIEAKDQNTVVTIPVVFHIVYNTNEENLHDSIIHNQLEILNNCFRRQNADTINTRSEFHNIVGDAKIQFELASVDPQGNPSNGITRTYTNIEYFSGDLLAPNNSNLDIYTWMGDSLYPHIYKITSDQNGGKSAWNTSEYINIWIGDLSINSSPNDSYPDFLFGMASPPLGHTSWIEVESSLDEIEEDGIIMHYKAIGSNNPVSYDPLMYNDTKKSGKVLIHEMGHYLGLRHIWGDGPCSVDDHISDTPSASYPSYNMCSFFSNSCVDVDSLNSVDLPDMVENYMDYSSGPCKNSFTNGQIAMMRQALLEFRPGLIPEILNIEKEHNVVDAMLYPNPTKGGFKIKLGQEHQELRLEIRTLDGKLISNKSFYNIKEINENIKLSKGMYMLCLFEDDVVIFRQQLVKN